MNKTESIQHLRDLSFLLDTKFKGPGGFKFGLDGLIGLIPIVGDVITSGISLYIIAQAAAMGVGPSTLIRMAINVGIENLFDMIPILGNFFDFYWKSNTKNLQLIEKHLENPARESIKSRMVVALICIALVVILIFSAYLTFIVINYLRILVLSALQ